MALALALVPLAPHGLALLGDPDLPDPNPTNDPLSGSNAPLNMVCIDDGGTFSSDTTHANSQDGLDVTLGDNLLNAGIDAVYYGVNYVYDRLTVDVGQAGTAGTQAWEYWNGTTWRTLTVTDASNGFTFSGTRNVTFTPPTDWSTTTLCSGTGYFVRSRTVTNYTLIPIADQVSARAYNLQVAVADELGTAVTGLDAAAFSVTNGTNNNVFNLREASSGTYELALWNGWASDDDYSLTVGRDGYVTPAPTATGTIGTQLTELGTLVLAFAVNVTSVTLESGASITTGTVSAGDGLAVACTNVGDGRRLCAVPVDDTEVKVSFSQDGYVTTDGELASDRADATDAQRSAIIAGVPFTLKLVLPTETTTTGVTFERNVDGGGWATVTPDHATGNTAYVAQSLAFSTLQYRATKYGVTNTTTTLSLSNASQTTATLALSASLANVTVTPQNTTAGATGTYAFAFDADHDWPADGRLVVAFPGGYGLPASPTVALAGADGTASASATGQTVTVTRAGDGAVTAGGTPVTVTISGLTNPGVSGATGTFSLALRDGTGDNLLDQASVAGVTLAAASLASVSATPASAVAGASTTYTFSFTLANDWPADGRAIVVLPSSLGASPTTATLTGADGTAAVSAGGTTLTVTRSGGTATAAGTAVTVAVDGITNPGVTGSTGTISVATTDADGDEIDTGVAQAVTITAGALADASVSVTDSTAGAATTYTIEATTANAWPADGRLVVTLPEGVDASAATVPSENVAGTVTAATAGQTLTLTRAGDGAATGAATALSIAVSGIANPPQSGATGTFALSLRDGNGTVIDAGTAAGIDVDPGALSGLATAPASDGAGAQTSYAFTFTNDNAWPAGGTATIQFPSGYEVASPTATLAGADGTATASATGANVTVTRAGDGSATAAGTAITVTVAGVTNPTTPGATGTFTVTLATAGGVDIDTGQAPAATIAAADLATIALTPATASIAVAGSQAFSAAGQDAFGNSVSLSTSWQASCGSVTSAGAYTAPTTPGTCRVYANQSGVSGSAVITVAAGDLTSIAVSPADATVAAGATQDFAASGEDAYGNAVAVTASWAATCGSIDSTGRFTAPSSPATCRVYANASGVSGSAAVTVTETLAAINLTPAAPELAAGGTQSFAAAGVSDDGDPVDVDPSWAVTCGSITSEGAYTAPTTTGTCRVYANASGVSGSATVTVVAGNAASVTVTPAAATIAIGATQAFSAAAADAYGNAVSGTPTWTADCGSVASDGTYTAPDIAGECTVTATIAGVAGTADVTVAAGALAAVATSPTSLYAGAATTYAFTFTLDNDWPADGKIQVEVPASFSTSGLSAALQGAAGTATAAASGTTITVTRAGDGAATAAGTTVTLTLTGLVNPASDGSTGSFAIATLDAAGDQIDAGTAPAVSVVTTALSVPSLSSSTHADATWTTQSTVRASWGTPEASGIAGYSYAVDADPDCASDTTSRSATVSGLSDGTHAFRVRAIASDGGCGPVATLGGLYVDALAPTVSVSSSLDADTCRSARDVTFSWSAGDATSGLASTQTYAYALDGAATTRTTATSAAFAGLSEGAHTLRVTAYDQAGNSATGTHRVLVDTTPPRVTLSAPGATAAGSATVTWSATDSCGTVASIQIEMQAPGGAWQSVAGGSSSTGSVSVSLPADGSYGFRAAATDAAGNTGTMPATAQATTVADGKPPAAPADVTALAQVGGHVRVQWIAATDAGSGVSGYHVDRALADGAFARVATVAAGATSHIDAATLHGATYTYRVSAYDAAGNHGPWSVSGPVSVDGEGPAGAPASLAVQGAADGLVTREDLVLEWPPVDGIQRYGVYASAQQTFPLDAAHRLGEVAASPFTVPAPRDGPWHFAVVALDDVGNPGPAVTASVVRDTADPTSAVTVAAGAGSSLLVSWSARDDGVGLQRVQLWSRGPDGTGAAFHASSAPTGTVAFWGRPGAAYSFWSVATDGLGRTATSAPTDAQAAGPGTTGAQTVASDAAALAIARLLTGDETAAAPPLEAHDRDGDGFPETIASASPGMRSVQVVRLESGSPALLVASDAAASSRFALWDPASDEVHEVKVTPPLAAPEVVEAPGAIVSTVRVTKETGWIYIPVPDVEPGLEVREVRRSDGKVLPPGTYWRQGGQIIVMDDPETGYSLVYAHDAQDTAPIVGWVLGPLVLAGGAAALVLAPPPHRVGGTRGRRGVAWALWHCLECRTPLPRLHRILRRAHECASGGPSLAQRVRSARTLPVRPANAAATGGSLARRVRDALRPSARRARTRRSAAKRRPASARRVPSRRGGGDVAAVPRRLR